MRTGPVVLYSSSHTQTYNSYINVNGRGSSGYIPYCRTGQLQLRVCFECARAKIGRVQHLVSKPGNEMHLLHNQSQFYRPLAITDVLSSSHQFYQLLLSPCLQVEQSLGILQEQALIKSTVRSIR